MTFMERKKRPFRYTNTVWLRRYKRFWGCWNLESAFI